MRMKCCGEGRRKRTCCQSLDNVDDEADDGLKTSAEAKVKLNRQTSNNNIYEKGKIVSLFVFFFKVSKYEFL